MKVLNRLGVLVLLTAGIAHASEFVKPSALPAEKTEHALQSAFHDVDRAGSRLVAVGEYGHIVYSEDHGDSWSQADVPVSSHLLAVDFVDSRRGWAVGHGGVILATANGGKSWELQTTDEETSERYLDFYRTAQDSQVVLEAQTFLAREEFLRSFGGTQSLMDVHFVDDQVGYAVGIFNRLLRTDNGGETWQPASHLIDNPMELHFYSIESSGDALYIAGEQGFVWRYSSREGYFESLETGYTGTLFGTASFDDLLIAYGMRGTVMKSRDRGKSWDVVEFPTNAGVTGGQVSDTGSIFLSTSSGELFISDDYAESFTQLDVPGSMGLYGMVNGETGMLTLVGEKGLIGVDFHRKKDRVGELETYALGTEYEVADFN